MDQTIFFEKYVCFCPSVGQIMMLSLKELLGLHTVEFGKCIVESLTQNLSGLHLDAVHGYFSLFYATTPLVNDRVAKEANNQCGQTRSPSKCMRATPPHAAAAILHD